jgi:hypothetical protein
MNELTRKWSKAQKSPAVDFFGVAQSPKSPSSGTLSMLLASRVMAIEKPSKNVFSPFLGLGGIRMNQACFRIDLERPGKPGKLAEHQASEATTRLRPLNQGALTPFSRVCYRSAP